ncbi:hypothetical protein L9F63_005928, partial [Diploptera punctata]
FAHAKEERGLFGSIGSNIVSAALAISSNVSSTISQTASNNSALIKDSFEKGIASAAQDLNNLKEKVQQTINRSFEEAQNASSIIREIIEENISDMKSAIDNATAIANKTMVELVEQAEQRGLDVSKCFSDFTSNISSISDASESEFEGCADPYVSPVADTSSHLSGLNSQFLQLSEETAQKFIECAMKLDIECYIAAAQNASQQQSDINSGVSNDMETLAPQVLLAKGGISSCGASSLFGASQNVEDAYEAAMKCLQNL